MDIGGELRQLRIMARLTQENAADLLIVASSTISKVENGYQKITAEEYFRWKAVYKDVIKVVSFEYIGPDKLVTA